MREVFEDVRFLTIEMEKMRRSASVVEGKLNEARSYVRLKNHLTKEVTYDYQYAAIKAIGNHGCLT